MAENKAAGFYDKNCDEYQDTEVERTNNLNNMQKIINRLLKKGNTATGCQTEDLEGIETIEDIKRRIAQEQEEAEMGAVPNSDEGSSVDNNNLASPVKRASQNDLENIPPPTLKMSGA